MNSPILEDDVVEFANKHSKKEFFTLAKNRPFTIRITHSGIRITLPNNSYLPASRYHINKYLKFYHAAPLERRRKTTIYKNGLREASYMARIFFEIEKEKALKDTSNNGLDDINSIPRGSISPDRASYSVSIVVRNPEVRRYVIESAKGKCEFCKQDGFLMANGKRYLEAHHIIALASDGEDTVDNVIALCSDHHRQAHFGANADELERKFLTCIKNRNYDAA
jgi:predicted HNH restriction endonuclease